jgi:membrane protein
MAQASALTYSTMLAFVPVLAVVFAIARGFGYNKYIELWFRDIFESQPQTAEVIVGFVNGYLVHTKSGIFLGIGLIFMLYTVLILMNNVEETFNQIWQVNNSRPIIRSFTNYLAVFLLFPILVIVLTGVSVFMVTLANSLSNQFYVGSALKMLLDFSAYVIVSLLFIGLYVYMPNTKVKLSCAIIPGILAGVAMQVLQLFYIHSQIWVTGYNAIYGSFAALPLFMLWLQISWTICLFGAQLTYTNQNLNRFGINLEPEADFHPFLDMTEDERGSEAVDLYSDRIDSL